MILHSTLGTPVPCSSSAVPSLNHPHQASKDASLDCLAACDIMRLHGSGSSGHNSEPMLRTALKRQPQQACTCQGIALSAGGTQAPHASYCSPAATFHGPLLTQPLSPAPCRLAASVTRQLPLAPCPGATCGYCYMPHHHHNHATRSQQVHYATGATLTLSDRRCPPC